MFSGEIWYRKDGGLVGTFNKRPYSVTKDSNPETWAMAQTYIKENPSVLISSKETEALEPEPKVIQGG